jgi:tetratricopeptide (TPR) repeat protein
MSPAELRALTPEALALKQQIEDKLKFIDVQNHFEILGIGREATKEQLKAAYLAAAKLFHPDRLVQYKLEPMREQVEKIFARLSEAQSALMDDRRRKEYLDTLDGAARGDAERARKILDAERAFMEGEMAVRHKAFTEAEEHFKRSVELNPDEGEHHAMLAWTIYQNPAHNRAATVDTVRQGLFRAIKLSRNNPRPYYLLGELSLNENELDKAIGCFRKALELRENHVEAERGLRLAMMRKEKGGEKKGGWFGRKK